MLQIFVSFYELGKIADYLLIMPFHRVFVLNLFYGFYVYCQFYLIVHFCYIVYV